MAQTGGLLLPLREVEDPRKSYFISSRLITRALPPSRDSGDQLRLKMQNVLAWRNCLCKLQGRASVGGELAAEATLMCKMVDLAEMERKPVAETVEKAQ